MQANTDHIKRAIGGFNWEVVLTKRDTNDKHLISNETITNIMGSFTPKENIFCKDRDALWMNLQIKTIILAKDKLYKLIARKNNDIHLRNSFNNLQKKKRKKMNDVIKNAKVFNANFKKVK